MAWWHNWDKSLSAQCAQFVQPNSIVEVQENVRDAALQGQTVRVVGAGHSWSSLVPTDGRIINLDKLNHITVSDRNLATVEVEAGIRLRELYPKLNAEGLAMRNLGAITAQSIAGAVATGTHGTGLAYGCLGTLVDGFTVIDGMGNLREFTAAQNPDEMRALRLNLGCLGIVVKVQLNCVANHNVRLRMYSASLEETLDQLSNLYTQNERVRIYWLPGSDRTFVHTMNRSDAPDDPGPVTSRLEAILLRNLLMGAIWELGDAFPDAIRRLNRIIEMGYRNRNVVGPVNEAITTPMPPFHKEAESAFPFDKAVKAIRALDELVRSQGLRVNVPSEIRFVKGDDLLLSPCNNGDVCYIGAYSASRTDEPRFFSGFREITATFGGRPHWGKINAPTRDEARRMYSGFEEFAALRQAIDPQGIFANQYIRDLFAL